MTITRYDREKDELHECLFWVEVNDDKVWVKRVVVALVHRTRGVVAPVFSIHVVKVHTFHRKGVDAALDVDLQPARIRMMKIIFQSR